MVMTLTSVVYQRLTGPTQPVSGSLEINSQNIKFKLLRSHESTSDAEMEIHVPDPLISGVAQLRRFKSHDTLGTYNLRREGDNLIVVIPKQPAAGKVVYSISLIDSEGAKHDLTKNPVIIRFTDPVPIFVIIPHVVLIFAAMMLSTRTGLEALIRGGKAYRLAIWTSVLLFVGGLIFGPIMQKFAFGEFWTGWPFGHDLTDNKTAVAMLFWLIALWRGRNRKSGGRGWIIVAAVVTLVIFLVPHSVHGSELDYTKMN